MTAQTEVKVGKNVQTGIGVGGTEVGGNGNARTVVVSEAEVDKAEVQTAEVQTDLGVGETGRIEQDYCHSVCI